MVLSDFVFHLDVTTAAEFSDFFRQVGGHSLTKLKKFCPLLTTCLPFVDIREENLHFDHISSTTYLPCLLNVLKVRTERPHVGRSKFDPVSN